MRIMYPSWDEMTDINKDLDPITLLRNVALKGTHPWELDNPPERFMGMAVGRGKPPRKHGRKETDDLKAKWDLDKKWFTD